MADVEPKPVPWLWQNRIPLGALTILDGDPDLGKSTVALDIAARVTNGAPMPGEADGRDPANVVVVLAEDNLNNTTRPRLDAARADPRRVFAVTAITPVECDDPSDEQPFTLSHDDLDQLEFVVREHRPRLIVIDPLMAYMPSGLDTNKDTDVRKPLGRLVRMAAQYDVAIVLVRHLRKGEGSAKHRGSGSIGITGIARSVLLVGEHPDDPESRCIALTKGNLASSRTPTLRYTFEETDCNAARICWHGACEVSAAQLATTTTTTTTKPSGELNQDARAAVALRAGLQAGPRNSRELSDEVIASVGCGQSTIDRVRKKLAVIVLQSGRQTTWSLPNALTDEV